MNNHKGARVGSRGRKPRAPELNQCRHDVQVMLVYVSTEDGHRSINWCEACGSIRETHYAQRRDRTMSKWRAPKRLA